MKEKKVSIIVPIYNTEKYLKKCIDSILCQTYVNIEVILVNDGSPDKSLKICREYELLDERICVIDKENGGLSSARNAGIDICTGEYITFVDSDDYLEKTAIQTLVDMVEYDHADVAYIHEVNVDESDNIFGTITTIHTKKEYDASSFLRAICERKVNCAVWGKLFYRDVFDEIRFNENRLNEDFLFLSELFLGRNLKIIEDEYCGYYYLIRENSISRHGFGKSSRDSVYNVTDMKNLAGYKDEKLVPYYGAYAAYQARTAIVIMTPQQYKQEKEFVLFCKKTIKDNIDYLDKSFLPIKDRIFCKIYLHAPTLTIAITRFIRRNK